MSSKKVLIFYSSGTGNTQRMAKAGSLEWIPERKSKSRKKKF
jgi:hypothetical protein